MRRSIAFSVMVLVGCSSSMQPHEFLVLEFELGDTIVVAGERLDIEVRVTNHGLRSVELQEWSICMPGVRVIDQYNQQVHPPVIACTGWGPPPRTLRRGESTMFHHRWNGRDWRGDLVVVPPGPYQVRAYVWPTRAGPVYTEVRHMSVVAPTP